MRPGWAIYVSPGRNFVLSGHFLAHSVDPNASYLAVVPAYNEARTVGRVVRSIRAHAPDFDVVAIDDGSTDGTGEVAEAAGARVLRHPFNLGIGGGVQTGVVYALGNRYNYKIPGDAHREHLAEEMPQLLQAMGDDPTPDI